MYSNLRNGKIIIRKPGSGKHPGSQSQSVRGDSSGSQSQSVRGSHPGPKPQSGRGSHPGPKPHTGRQNNPGPKPQTGQRNHPEYPPQSGSRNNSRHRTHSGKRRGRRRKGSILLVLIAAVLLWIGYRNQWFSILENIGGDDWHYDATKPASYQNNPAVEGELKVHFLDVGQGNAVLVTNGNASMLVDGGNRDYSSFVVSYLQKQQVGHLDYIVSSHYDADHIHGLIGALNAFSVDMVLDGDYEWDTQTYESFQSALDTNGCEEVHPRVGEVYQLGDAEFTIVCPDDYDHEESNDNSIGIRIVYGNTSFLICGDADSQMEQWMIESGRPIDSDVLLCSHHGSTYSTSEEFLRAVSPQAAVISCGLNNSYGHPSERVMNLLKDYGCDVYRTDKQSTIIATSDGQNITFQCQPTTDYSSGE